MKKIHMEIVSEKVVKGNTVMEVAKHYFYLCDGPHRVYLYKQRPYKSVGEFFRQDLPVNRVYSHKWGRNKMLDKLMEQLSSRIASEERYLACATY